MTAPIVTHADLPRLRDMRARLIPDGERDLLDRLITAAEADAPPLPEGWVLLTDETGNLQHPYWHEGGRLHSGRLLGQGPHVYTLRESASDLRDRLTPLRPTINGEDFQRALDAWDSYGETRHLNALRAAFTAAGVVIEP